MVSGIPNIINDLSNDLKARIEAVVQLTENLEDTQNKLELAKRDLKRVQIALEALSGNEIPIPASADTQTSTILYSPGDPSRDAQRLVEQGEQGFKTVPVPVPVPVQTPAIPLVDPRPQCNSCGSGRMNYTSRTLNNGKVVQLWLCSECRNERF